MLVFFGLVEIAGRKLTVEAIVVTKLPQRLKMAKIPSTISARVIQNASVYAANIPLATFSYAFKPSWRSLGNSVCTVVLLRSHTSMGLNQNAVLRGEQ